MTGAWRTLIVMNHNIVKNGKSLRLQSTDIVHYQSYYNRFIIIITYISCRAGLLSLMEKNTRCCSQQISLGCYK